MAMQTSAPAHGGSDDLDWRVCTLDSVDSTNLEARRRAGDGAEAGLWVIAREQTAGRGRRGRPWVSRPGNLYTSVLLRPREPSERLGELTFVAALALHDAILELAPQLATDIHLKWPNDVISADGKLAGILLETETDPVGRHALVIGWGVNCLFHPMGADYPATALAALGAVIQPLVLFAELSEAFKIRLAQWQADGMTAIRDAWMERARGVGEAIVVRLSDQELHGLFEGLDEAGRLVLRDSTGDETAISAGDVFFRTPDKDPGDG